MTDKQKYAVEMAASIMKNHISQHCNMALGNRESGVVVHYTEAINILLDMLLGDSERTCNCKCHNTSKENEPYREHNSNSDRIRHMSDEELAKYIYDVSEHCADCVVCGDDCDSCNGTEDICVPKIIEWLKSESED